MCGIFGMVVSPTLKQKGVRKYVDSLLLEMETHGGKATGLAVLLHNTIKVIKGPLKASEFINTDNYNTFANEYFQYAKAILGHCRLPTQGSELNNLNNHPIVTERIVGIHKGVLTNSEELFKKTPSLKRKGEVDSEAIFQLLSEEFLISNEDSINKLRTVVRKLSGSVVAAFFSRLHPDNMWLFKGSDGGGVALVRMYTLDTWMFGDTFPLGKALKKVGHEIAIKDILPENTAVRFSLASGKIYSFKLK